MKKFAIKLPALLLALILLLSPLVSAASQHVRLGYIKTDPTVLQPLILQDYYSNYLDELAKQADWTYQLVPLSASECMDALQSGNIDLLLSVEYPLRPLSEDPFRYSTIQLGYDLEGLYMRPDEDRFNAQDLSTLRHAKVGLIAGREANAALAEFQHNNQLQLTTHYYPDQHSMIEALEQGDIDLIADTATNMTAEETFLLAYAAIPMHVASTPQSVARLHELEDAWQRLHIENPAFEEVLNAGFSQRIAYQLVHYAPSESRFIQKQPPLRVAIYAGSRPYITMDDQTGQASGIYADLFQQISKNSGLQFTFIHTSSYDEAVQMVHDGQADILIDVFTDTPSMQDFAFTNPLFGVNYSFVSTYNQQPLDDDGVIALSQPAPSLLTYLQQKFPEWQFIASPSKPAECLALVSSHQADFALLNNLSLDTERPLSLHPNLTIVHDAVVNVPISLAISPQQPHVLQSVLNKAILQLDPRLVAQIIHRHTIAHQPQLTLQYLLTFYPLHLGLACGIFLLLCAIGLFLRHHSQQMRRHQIMLSHQNELLQVTIEELQKTSTSRDTYQQLAETDALTGTLNKAAIERVGGEILSQPPTTGCCHALLIIDLDHFKEANDSCGHQFGDDVLQRFAQVLPHILRPNDAVGRFGGDEFILILNNLPPQSVASIAERINEAARQLSTDEAGQPHLSASIGAALCPQHGQDYQTLLNQADQALYQVKRRGRNDWQLFS